MADKLPPHRFSATNQPKRRGKRKPSILTKYIRDNGITPGDAQKAFRYILGLSYDEITKIVNDKKQPIFVITIAMAVLADMKKGKLENLNIIMKKAGVDPEKEIEQENTISGEFEEAQFTQYSFPVADPL